MTRAPNTPGSPRSRRSRAHGRFLAPFAAVVLIGSLLGGCDNAEQRAAGPSEQAGTRVVANPVTHHFTIEGMTCQSCVNGITAKVNELPGVGSVSISLDEQQAVITASESLAVETILAAIETMGFTVTPAPGPAPENPGLPEQPEPDDADRDVEG